jgi:hypothetical protein
MMTREAQLGALKIWALNFGGNGLLVAAAYYWLQVPDARGWQIAISGLLAVCVAFSILWLRAGTLAYFRVAVFRERGTVWPAFRRSLRHLLVLSMWVAVAGVLIWGLWNVSTYTPQAGVWLRQKLNSGPTPRNVTRDLNWLLMVVAFILIPALWLPVATTLAGFGWISSRIRAALHVIKRPSYWVGICAIVMVGLWVPYQIAWWISGKGGVRQQAWSAGLRFFAAYVIAVTAWVVLVWFVGAFTSREDPEP